MKTLLAASLLLTYTSLAIAEEVGCGIEVIPENKISYGCGCGYWLETKPTLKPLLQTKNFDWSSSFIQVNGELVQVQPVNVEQIPTAPELDNTFIQHYKTADTDIVFTNTISFTCPPGGAAGCDLTRFNSIATISNMHCEVKLNLTGDCGC